jgi:hypothetical protein
MTRRAVFCVFFTNTCSTTRRRPVRVAYIARAMPSRPRHSFASQPAQHRRVLPVHRLEDRVFGTHENGPRWLGIHRMPVHPVGRFRQPSQTMRGRGRLRYLPIVDFWCAAAGSAQPCGLQWSQHGEWTRGRSWANQFPEYCSGCWYWSCRRSSWPSTTGANIGASSTCAGSTAIPCATGCIAGPGNAFTHGACIRASRCRAGQRFPSD